MPFPWSRLAGVLAGALCAFSVVAAQQGVAPMSASPAQAPATQDSATGAISGVVTDAATHQPLDGVNVYLGPPPRAGTASRMVYQITDERGRFVFTGLPAGTYFINATKFGFLESHYGPGAMGKLGADLIITDGQWFGAANFEMSKLGAIGGFVTDEHGEPVVGAYVRVLTQLMIAGQPQLAAGPATKTNDLGEYRIAGLPPGKYIVSVPSVQHSVPTSMSAAEIEGMSPQMFATSEAAAGRSGTPPTRRNGGALPMSDAAALILGNYITPPAPVNGHAQAYPPVFYPGALSLAAAVPVELGAGGEKSGVDLTLQPVAAVSVSGRVDATPDAFKSLVLRMMPAGLEDLGAGSEAATAPVASDGSFTFLNVPAGAYTLIASRSQFEFQFRPAQLTAASDSLPIAPGTSTSGGFSSGALLSGPPGTNSNARTSPGPAFVGRQHVSVGTADVTNVIVQLQSTLSLHGKVVYEDYAGPAPGRVSVGLEPANGRPALAMPHSNSTPPQAPVDDTFTVDGILPGEYVIHVAAVGAASLSVKSMSVDGEDYSRRPLEATAGHDIDNVVITLSGKNIKVSGTVHDSRGAAAPQSSVLFFATDKTLWSNYGYSPTWIRELTSASDGSYGPISLRAGEYYVVAVDRTNSLSWQDPGFLESIASSAKRVTFEWGDTKTMDVTLVVKR